MGFAVAVFPAVPALVGADPTWEPRVQAVLDQHCVKCHGPIEQKSGLVLDTPQGALRGGDEGPVVVPGKPAASRLVTYLAADADPHMPPKKQLSEAEVRLLSDWVSGLGTAAAPAVRSGPVAPRDFPTVEGGIDALLAEAWAARGVRPAAAVEEDVWCRRVHLDLVGRVPTPEEAAAFLAEPAGERRVRLVDRLLASEGYAVRMRELWDVLLMGRPRRADHEDRRKQNGWWGYLERAFRENRPWDRIVRDLVEARGDAPEVQGASWFLHERRNNAQAMAEAVAPLVYGTRLDCAQCHDHPLAREIRQGHYWGLVAVFNRSRNVDGGNQVGESAIGGFVNFTNLKKESQPAIVTLLDGRVLEEQRPADGVKEEDADGLYLDPGARVRVPRFSRRGAFAQMATEGNALLSRAFVNRMWAVLVGRGLVHPVDEMTGRNRPSHPELLDWLASDFRRHGHDVRRLVRGIVLSRVYGLGLMEAGVPVETFAGVVERSLTAEQVARSWEQVTGLKAPEEKLRRAAVVALPEVCPRETTFSFQQAQFLEHTPHLLPLLDPKGSGLVARLAATPTPEQRIGLAFESVLGRRPDADEQAAALDLLRGVGLERAGEGGRELLWALLTSTEFLTVP